MGYLHVYTGEGKGKTSAAFGMALRALGRGKRVFIGQFLKHEASGEVLALRDFPGVELRLFGSPRHVGDPMGEKDGRAALEGLSAAREAVASGAYQLVILDELNIALGRGLLAMADVEELIASGGEETELVFTGRYAPRELREAADLVTEMVCERHYSRKGVAAREGIEY